MSGSGKTSVTDELVGRLPALRARSDVERKRLHGLEAAARTGSSVGGGLYAAAASRHTYAALADIADRLLRNGQNALIDATFLHRRERLDVPPGRRGQRGAFRDSRLHGLGGRASQARRGADRAGRDASEANRAVLEHQLRTQEPLDRSERRVTVAVDTSKPIRYEDLVSRLRRV